MAKLALATAFRSEPDAIRSGCIVHPHHAMFTVNGDVNPAGHIDRYPRSHVFVDPLRVDFRRPKRNPLRPVEINQDDPVNSLLCDQQPPGLIQAYADGVKELAFTDGSPT